MGEGVAEMSRPICPECDRELIFVTIVLEGSGEMFKTWQCDCEYRDGDCVPEDVVQAIVRAREGDEYAASYNWGKVVDGEN